MLWHPEYFEPKKLGRLQKQPQNQSVSNLFLPPYLSLLSSQSSADSSFFWSFLICLKIDSSEKELGTQLSRIPSQRVSSTGEDYCVGVGVCLYTMPRQDKTLSPAITYSEDSFIFLPNHYSSLSFPHHLSTLLCEEGMSFYISLGV